MTTSTAPPDAPDESGHRPFAAWLHEQRRGLLHDELGEKLAEVVAAVNEYGKPGELFLKLRISPATKHGEGVVVVADQVGVKKPEAPRPESVFYIDADSNLVKNDPKQQAFELREVARGRADTPDDPRTAQEA